MTSDALIDQAPDDTAICRYMDLARFAALAFSSRLWFAKLRTLWLGDPWEGFGRAKGLPRPSKGGPKVWQGAHASQLIYAESSGYAAKTVRSAHDHVFANSWCRGDETLGMWERYGDLARGVAIESTVGRVKDSIQRTIRPEQYGFGLVRYEGDLHRSKRVRSDFTKGSVPLSGSLWQRTLSIAFNKRTCFSDENEWRAAIFQELRRSDVVGLDVPVKLDTMIKKVRIGPRADRPTIDAVNAIIVAARISAAPEESSILKRPRVRRSR